MSIQHVAWALGQPTGSPTRKSVLVALANRVNPDTELCCPSISRLVFETEFSRSTVKRALDELEADGLIRKIRRSRSNGSDTSNEYQFPYVSLTKGRFTVDPGPAQSGPPPRSTVDPPEPKEVTERETIAAAPRNSAKPNRSHPQWDPVWDALAYVFGIATTAAAKSRRAKVCGSLVGAGAKPDEVIARASAWPQHFDTATLTDTALEKHWDTLGRKPLRRR